MVSQGLPADNDLAQRVAAARREVEANVLRLDMARSRLQATTLGYISQTLTRVPNDSPCGGEGIDDGIFLVGDMPPNGALSYQ